MRITTKATIAAGAVALTAIVLPAFSASALPPPGDGGGNPIERTTTTRSQATMTTTAVPRRLESLSVTTDSVVATATIRYNGDPSSATVQWGDGASTPALPSRTGRRPASSS